MNHKYRLQAIKEKITAVLNDSPEWQRRLLIEVLKDIDALFMEIQ